MLNISKEKLEASLSRLHLFIKLAESSKQIGPADSKRYQKRAEDLIEKVMSGKLDLEASTEKYNALVKKVNSSLPRPTFPEMDLRSIENLLRSDILAYENIINLDMNSGHLEIEDEVALFKKAIGIWEDVGRDSAHESVKRFSFLVKQTNGKLPSEVQLPMPKADEYPFEQL